MGKKRKHGDRSDASSSKTPPRKHRKRSTQGPPPPPPAPPPPPPLPSLERVEYAGMPLNHKKKFYIYDDCGSLQRYIELIAWLRCMGCFDGSVFDDIPNLNCSPGSYPLVEIEIFSPQDHSAKFLISKQVLYLIGFLVRNGWYQFSGCGFDIDNCTVLEGRGEDGKYLKLESDKPWPWEHVGPKAMIDAVNFLATNDLHLTNGGVTNHVKSCAIFFVHLSESARLFPVESYICRSLKPPLVLDDFNKRTYENEEALILVPQEGDQIGVEDDVYCLVKEVGHVDFKKTVTTEDYIRWLVGNFSKLSKYWYVYSLSGRKLAYMEKEDVSQGHMRSIKSLRCTLSVLCNINLSKVLKQWKKRIGHEIKCTHPPQITQEIYDGMAAEIRQLQDQKKVLSVGSL